MKSLHTLLHRLPAIAAAAIITATAQAQTQDSLWFQSSAPGHPVRSYYIGRYDSIALMQGSGNIEGVLLRMYSKKAYNGYRDLPLQNVVGKGYSGRIYFSNPGNRLWDISEAKYYPAKMTINTTGGASIDSKENYVGCDVTIEDSYNPEWNLSAPGKIRGRGNSSWLWYDKKPYRIKFTKKQSVMGLDKNKDWVLLANYRDPTDMMNTFVFCMGEGEQLPYTNHTRYVEVTLNGEDIGLYQLTEQVEQAKSRVNINSKRGLLLSLDVDDGPQDSPHATDNFWSQTYNMPVCVKCPKDPDSLTVDSAKRELNALEQAIKSGNYNIVSQALDIDQFIKYMLIQELIFNVEVAAPRSMYLFKDTIEGDKWHMGPLWDFDAGYDFDWSYMKTGHGYFDRYNVTVLGTKPATQTGTYGSTNKFFTDLWKVPQFVQDVKRVWAAMKPRIVSEYWQETLRYSKGCEDALKRDAEIWPITKTGQSNDDWSWWGWGDNDDDEDELDPIEQTEEMGKWIANRVNYLDGIVNNY